MNVIIVLSMLFLSSINAITIKDITINQGIIPIDLGPAKVYTKQHSFIHYFSIKEIFEQLDNLNEYYKSVTDLINYNNSNLEKIINDYNYVKIVNHTKSVIEEKLEILYFNNKETTKNVRIKRGILNGLGTIVKSITGNLDANDGEIYNQLIDKLKYNQYNIVKQIENGYSMNTDAMLEFKESLKVIDNNFKELKTKLTYVSKEIDDYFEIDKITDILNQLDILYTVVLSLIRDIENSLTFCKLETMHPSIISVKEFYIELSKIASYYVNQLPFNVTIENIRDYEAIAKIHCNIYNNEIMYIINIPIVEETKYSLYELYSIPSEYESTYVTLLPKYKYVLKNIVNNDLIALNEKCTNVKENYLCSAHQIIYDEINCETAIINLSSTEKCKYFGLNIEQNSIKWIEKINQYLAVLPKEETIIIKTNSDTSSKVLKGIYLIKLNDEKVIFRNKSLMHSSLSIGHPKFIDINKLELKGNQKPEFSIDIKNLDLDKINLNNIVKIDQKEIVLTKISIWTLFLYKLCIIIGLYFIFIKFCKRTSEVIVTPDVLFGEGGVI